MFGFSIRKIKYFYYKIFGKVLREVEDKGGEINSSLATQRERHNILFYFCLVEETVAQKNAQEEEGEKQKKNPLT